MKPMKLARRPATSLVALFVSAGFTPRAHAAPDACNESGSAVALPYVVAMDTAPLLDPAGITPEQFRYISILAAGTWNEQTSGPYFVYQGDYVGEHICTQRQLDCANAEPWAEDCDAQWIYEMACEGQTEEEFDCAAIPDGGVLIGTQNRVGWGEKRTICGNASRVTINALSGASTPANPVPQPYGPGLPAIGETDPVTILMHELGHVVGFGDYYDDQGTIMTTVPAKGRLRRDLFEFERRCVDEDIGRRGLSGYRRYQEAGAFGNETLFTGAYDVTHVSPGLSRSLGSPHWAAVANGPTDALWSPGISAFVSARTVPYTSWAYTTSAAANPRTVRFRGTSADTHEDPNADYLLYSTETDYPDNTTNGGRHKLRYVRSLDGFATVPSRGTMTACTNMSGWNTCAAGATADIYTARSPVVAFDEVNALSLTAWLVQGVGSSADLSDHHEVVVAAGQVDADTLGEVQALGVKSAVTPGMACGHNGFSNRDCFVAYVDLNDADGDLEIVRFSLQRQAAEFRYGIASKQLIAAPNGLRGVKTASSIAAWYHNGRYYMAVKTLQPGQPVRVFSSRAHGVTGDTWTEVVGNFGFTVAGPEVIPYWQGNNALVTTR